MLFLIHCSIMRTMTLPIDIAFWRYISPAMKPGLFKIPFIRLMGIAYVSMFSMPRRFLRHYLSGKGTIIFADTQNVIDRNPRISAALKEKIRENLDKPADSGVLHVPQVIVDDPDTKYSLGSFMIAYERKENIISLQLRGSYSYKAQTTRITKHLHAWLRSKETNGVAKSFDFKGDRITMNTTELFATEEKHYAGRNRRLKSYINLNILYL